jgi:short chain dehydrogenase
MTDWTARDLPAFSGRTVIVTGANSGLGLVTARELARVGGQVILAVRNLDKGKAAAAKMSGDVEVRHLDLQDLASVREFADGIEQVGVLVNNAGIMAVPYAQTVDGFESQIGTNHLGHFALTNLLLPKITDRVVTVSSIMQLLGYISLKDLNWKSRPYLAWLRCQVVRRGQQVGGHRRRLRREPVPGDSFIGPWFGMRGPTERVLRSPLARNGKSAGALWELSEQLTGAKFSL